MGTYTYLRGKMEPEPVADKNRQFRVDELKDELRRGTVKDLEKMVVPEQYSVKAPGVSPSDLAQVYRQLRARKALIDAADSECNMAIEAVSQLLIDAYANEDLTSVKMQDDGSVSVQYEPTTKVEDPQAFRDWAVGEGLDKLFSMNYNTMNSMMKERLLNGIPEAPGTRMFLRAKLVLR